jgi:hypothetical protein
VVVPAGLFRLKDKGTYRLPVLTGASPAGGVLPPAATAVVMNVTATGATNPGFLQVFNAAGDRGKSSNLNFDAGDVAPNLVIAPIAADGSVRFYVNRSTDVIADVIGYFTGASSASSSTALFVPFTPKRLVDTRKQGGPLSSPTLPT